MFFIQYSKLPFTFIRSLSSCPFCGGIPSLTVYRVTDSFVSMVFCPLCRVAISRYHSDIYKSVDLVVDSWNSSVG